MKKSEPKGIKPFGICGEKLVDLYLGELEKQHEKRLVDNPASSNLVKQLLRNEASQEALLRLINKNNHTLTEDVYNAISDYFFNLFKVNELTNKVASLEIRLTDLEQKMNRSGK